MLSDISSKTYKAMKREAGDSSRWQKRCHKPAIRQRTERKNILWMFSSWHSFVFLTIFRLCIHTKYILLVILLLLL